MLSKENALLNAKKLLADANLLKNLGEENLCTAYASGSIFEGFGNSRSDVDIFIIVNEFNDEAINLMTNLDDDCTFYDGKNVKTIVTTKNKIDFDIEIYEIKYILDYIDAIDEKKASSHDDRFDVFHRLKFAEAIENYQKLNDLKKRINYDFFNLIAVNEARFYHYGKITDIMGSYEEKKFDTSFKMALDLLEVSISAYLSLMGETNPNPKWLMKKINKFSNSEKTKKLDLFSMLGNAYKDIVLNDSNNLKNKTVEILKDCQVLNFECEKELKDN